ncbi:MAG: hypothetical protein EOO63_12150 [Hymenobacter sp.]|nr:MAG: hypothetical protein EOO63_12150 [Hymenobacter sp.]
MLKTSNPVRFEQLMVGLDANQLIRLYHSKLKLRRVTRNIHDPAVKDSILVVATPADHLDLFKNRDKALLRGATITSTKVRFAGMRVGVSKEQFCRTLHLSSAYQVYTFTDGMENFVQLTFTFLTNKLSSVVYEELIAMDGID